MDPSTMLLARMIEGAGAVAVIERVMVPVPFVGRDMLSQSL